MFNVCRQCGEYSVEKIIDSTGPFAICPTCHYAQPFLQQPLFIITGPSGAGKTALCLELAPLLRNRFVVLESDILWGTFSDTPENEHRAYHNMWLRMAKNIGQSGLPIILCGTVLPDQIEPCEERRYFSTIHYLSLICDDADLINRLKQRPSWRGASNPIFLREMLHFNHW